MQRGDMRLRSVKLFTVAATLCSAASPAVAGPVHMTEMNAKQVNHVVASLDAVEAHDGYYTVDNHDVLLIEDLSLDAYDQVIGVLLAGRPRFARKLVGPLPDDWRDEPQEVSAVVATAVLDPSISDPTMSPSGTPPASAPNGPPPLTTPAPAAAWLFLAGLAGLGARCRRA